MEGLRWPAMVFGLFGAAVAFVSGFVDMLASNLGGGLLAIAGSILVCAISAMTPSLPGWSAGLFVVTALVFLVVSSFAVAFSGPLLLIAAILGGFASWGRKRTSAARHVT